MNSANRGRNDRGRRPRIGRSSRSQAHRPVDLTITVHRIELDEHGLFATWTCASPVFPGPIHGCDRYRLREDRIAELTTQFEPAI